MCTIICRAWSLLQSYTQNVLQMNVGESYHIEKTKFHTQAQTQNVVFKKPYFLTFVLFHMQFSEW